MVPPLCGRFVCSVSSNSHGDYAFVCILLCTALHELCSHRRNWVSLRMLLVMILRTLGSVGNFGILIFLFYFIFGIIGLDLFANKLQFDPYICTLMRDFP